MGPGRYNEGADVELGQNERIRKSKDVTLGLYRERMKKVVSESNEVDPRQN